MNERQYVKPVNGKAEIKNDDGVTITIDIPTALDCYNKFDSVRKILGFPNFFGKDVKYIDPTAVEDISFINGHIVLYTTEATTDEYIRYMLLLPEKVYAGAISIRKYYQDLINEMSNKLSEISGI